VSRWDGLNRRKFPRVIYPCLVVIQNSADGSRDIILTHTENIGIGGVCIVLKQDLKMFTVVDLELDLLDLGNHIKCQGKVVWNVQRRGDAKNKPMFYDIGIEFMELSQEEHERLEKIIKRLVKSAQEAVSP
jgi:Tfp pilus assembly protein PilZ